MTERGQTQTLALDRQTRRWLRLEHLTYLLGSSRVEGGAGRHVTQFCRLYRDLCSDLCLANARQLSEPVIQYLHSLVSRAHSQLYRSVAQPLPRWPRLREILLRDVPPRIYRDPCFRVAMVTFFLPFLLSMALAYFEVDYSRAVLGESMMSQLESMYGEAPSGRNLPVNVAMSSFYIRNNLTIALQCFATGIFFGLGSVLSLFLNGFLLGAIFGCMLSSSCGPNFVTFVLSHAPFELTGIAVAGAAGMKLGYSLVDTNGYSRLAALRRTARESIPMIGVASALILMAAFIEGFWSPLPVPIFFKYGLCALSCAILVVYFLVLGRRAPHET